MVKTSGVRYHISPQTQRPNICRAQPGKCPLRSGNEPAPHFETKEEARAHVEQSERAKNGNVSFAVLPKKIESALPTEDSIVKGADFRKSDLRVNPDGSLAG